MIDTIKCHVCDNVELYISEFGTACTNCGAVVYFIDKGPEQISFSASAPSYIKPPGFVSGWSMTISARQRLKAGFSKLIGLKEVVK